MATTIEELRRVSPAILLGWVVAVAAGTAASFCGRLHWLCDLLSNGRLQALELSLLLLLTALACRLRMGKHRTLYILLAIVCIANFFPLIPYLIPHLSWSEVAGIKFRAVSFNVYTPNQRFTKVLRYLTESQADVIVLNEVNGAWVRELSPIQVLYPHTSLLPREDNFGIAVYSKYPLEGTRVETLGEAAVPTVITNVNFDGRKIAVIATHPVPPSSVDYFRMRNEQLELLATMIREMHSPTMLLGDMNVSPWSPFFSDFLSASDLRDSSAGKGIHRTWPSTSWLFRIGLDHCLISSQLYVRGKTVGPALGSDHLPIAVDLTYVAELSEKI